MQELKFIWWKIAGLLVFLGSIWATTQASLSTHAEKIKDLQGKLKDMQEFKEESKEFQATVITKLDYIIDDIKALKRKR